MSSTATNSNTSQVASTSASQTATAAATIVGTLTSSSSTASSTQQPRKIFVVPQTTLSQNKSQLTSGTSATLINNQQSFELTAKNKIKIIPINNNIKVISSNPGTSTNLPATTTVTSSKKVNLPVVANNSQQALTIKKTLNELTGQLTTTSPNNKQVQVVKIINSTNNSSQSTNPIFKIAKIQSTNNVTTTSTSSIVNKQQQLSENSIKNINSQQTDSLRLHTYQLTKPVKPSTTQQNLFIHQQQQQQPTTSTTSQSVIHKIQSPATNQPTITKTTSSINNYQIVQKNNNNLQSSNQIVKVTTTSQKKDVDTYLNTESTTTTTTTTTSSTADNDTIKRIYNAIQTNQSQSSTQPQTTSSYSSIINTTTTSTAKIKASNESNSSNNRKPCNCTKSMCLKLYCDCFAMGSFCHNCNCINCHNTLEHEDERNKAIKMVLDRNPSAFQSKIGKFAFTTSSNASSTTSTPTNVTNTSIIQPEINEKIDQQQQQQHNTVDEIHSRHIKGCNCKKSNCLKRYCECFLAKIQCSSLCRCVGCKNCDESTKSLLQLANAADLRKQQMTTSYNKFAQFDMNLSTQAKYLNMSKSYSFVNTDVAEAACSCLIAQAEESEHQNLNDDDIETFVIEEFGRCLIEIINTAAERMKK